MRSPPKYSSSSSSSIPCPQLCSIIPSLLCLIVASITIIATATAKAPSLCSQRCGEILVPSPLSSLPGCGHPQLQLECSSSKQHHQEHFALLLHTDTESFRVLQVTATTLVIDATSLKATSCNGSEATASLGLKPTSPYFLSGNNEFFLTGCNAGGNYSTDLYPTASRCQTSCHNSGNRTARNPFCTLEDCCVITIPAGARSVVLTSCAPRSCGFSSVIFPKSYVPSDSSYGVELMWEVPGSTCASVDDINLCSTNANCVNASNVPGYNCLCKDGFAGDGYRNGSGCLPVDHCSPGSCAPKARCINEGTSFRCKCLAGYEGNGTLTGGCAIKRYVILLPAIGAPALLVFGFFLWKFRPKLSALPGTRNLKHLQASFKENSRIFTWAEMERATKCFRSDLKLGTGSFGTVYKGKLDDGTTVAIKKANNGNAPRIQQFLNEVTILSKVNHRNLVKMLGCCIEREVPLLVYEFVPRGTLYEHLHRRGDTLSWKNRLRIATETAEALTYLHFAASPPIYHRDVKSSNILLDEKLTAKVADFGISKLVPIDSTHISTTLHGTPGYIDPQYQQSYQLTDKSDVYSFGVVILEVITGQMPVDFSRCASDKNLSTFAMSVIQRGAISELIDKRLDARTPEMLECVAKVANLAALCLQFDGSSRPTMKFVLEELKKAMQPLME